MSSSYCYQYALGLLARAEQSSFTLRRKLKLKGHLEADIEEALGLLAEKNYLNDERYVQAKIKSLLLYRGRGIHYIQAKLNQEGFKVSNEQIKAIASENQISQTDTLIAAREKLLNRRGWQLKTLDQKSKTKLIQGLQRQGFNLREILQWCQASIN